MTVTGMTVPALQLPQVLEPWRDWLTLFPPELMEPVGQLLLRLAPLVGRLKSASQRINDEPIGVGNIVQRGQYDRLLMSEWLFADAEPDEFIRRAANGELMFLGPEPDIRLRSQLCVALFDAGPLQLGEPRLAHMVMFILLSRRAEEAGAQFKWGILQEAGVLHETTGREAIQALLAARSLLNPKIAEFDQWNAALVTQLDTVCDCWQLSAPQVPRIQAASNLVTIQQHLFSPSLHLTLSQRNNRREVRLDMPANDVAIRLLREPFKRLDSQAQLRQSNGRPSLKQAPRFSAKGGLLAVPQLDGGAVVYHVPQSTRAAPGKPRTTKRPEQGSILAAGVFGKNLSYILADGNELIFRGFPSQHFSHKKVKVLRPEMKYFRASVGASRWLSTYFATSAIGGGNLARVIVLDIDKHLVYWESSLPKYRAGSKSVPIPTEPVFKIIANSVVGTDFFDGRLLFAVASGTETTIYRWYGYEDAPYSLGKIPQVGQRVLFGDASSWHSGTGLLAIQLDATQWWIGLGKAEFTKSIPETATVVALAKLNRDQQGSQKNSIGLIVLSSDNKTIQFISQTGQVDLHKSAEPIARVTVDTASGNIAWILRDSLGIKVCNLKDDGLLLNVTVNGVVHAR